MPRKSCALRYVPACLCLAAFALATIPIRAHGEELGVSGGTIKGNDGAPASYSWEIDYRQHLLPGLDASFAYLNEGHFPGHHRDGGAVQLWAVTPRWFGHVELSAGAGPYLYFDTQDTDTTRDFRDDHGIGALVTESVSWYGTGRWFVRLSLNEVYAPKDLDTHMLLLSAGYQVDNIIERLGALLGREDDSSPLHARNELEPFVGQSIENTNTSGKSTNFGVEYRRRMARHLELSVSWLNEAVGIDGRHDGVTGEAWLIDTLLDHRLSVGVGAGPYVALHSYHVDDGRSAASVTGVASMTLSWRMTRSTALRLVWHRTFTQDDEDRDIVTAGVAYRWGR